MTVILSVAKDFFSWQRRFFAALRMTVASSNRFELVRDYRRGKYGTKAAKRPRSKFSAPDLLRAFRTSVVS
jgi:hypothetical protein